MSFVAFTGYRGQDTALRCGKVFPITPQELLISS